MIAMMIVVTVKVTKKNGGCLIELQMQQYLSCFVCCLICLQQPHTQLLP